MTNRPTTWSRAFTIVELMMSLALLAIGVAGIIAMQKVTVSSNQHSKSLAIATRVAQAWSDQLAADASLWTRSQGLTNTAWLSQVATTTSWIRPAYNANRGFGAAFDALGNPIDEQVDGALSSARFCVHIRLVPIYPVTGTLGLIRTSVRVVWPRYQGTEGAAFCGTSRDVASLGASIDDFHFAYQTAAVRVQP